MSKKRYKNKQIIDKKFGFEGLYILLWAKRIHFIHVVLVLVVFYFVWHVTIISLENNDIKKNGQILMGVIDDTRKVGGKGIRRCSYHFTTMDKRFEGFIDDDYLKVGDSIEIMFLNNNPTKNRPTKFFER
jgi:hypothetical protein